MSIRLPSPELQIGFAAALERARNEYLLDALLTTVSTLDVTRLNQELGDLAPGPALQLLAGNGLRGEVVFAVPYVLEANPRLLGYYRLLLGYSQKAFYTSATGLSGFASMEVSGTLNNKQRAALPALSAALIEQAAILLSGLGSPVTVGRLDDLTLLTLGPQLRGGSNVAKGTQAIADLFHLIQDRVG